MSLLLLYRPHEGEEPEPSGTPTRMLLGVGLTLALLVVPFGALIA